MREGMPYRQEGKGGKVKSQVAYDTVLEIGGKLDDGVPLDLPHCHVL